MQAPIVPIVAVKDLEMKNAKPPWMTRWVFSPLAGITLSQWGGLMLEHGRHVGLRYVPRSLFTAGMALLNSGWSFYERRRYRSELDSVAVRAPIFVLGHHRSGTTHLWNLLAQDPRFAYPTILQAVFPHTFLSFERFVHGLAGRFVPNRRPQDNVEMSPDSPLEEERALCASTFLSIQMARHFPRRRDAFKPFLSMREASPEARQRWSDALDLFSRKLLVRHGPEKTLLFKAPDHTAKVDLILQRFPDARFVHIHRDPFTVFLSTRKMERQTVPLYAYETPPSEGLDAFILWRYREMYRCYFEDRDRIPPGQLVEVSFDDLEKEPLDVIERIYEGLGLSDFAGARPRLERYLGGLRGYRKNSYTPLAPSLREEVERSWSPYYERLGYGSS